jgi:hypothetical protein
MKFLKIFSSIPERTYVLLFLIIIIISSAYTYFQIEDASSLDKKIATRQKELERTIMLKDIYLAKKRNAEGLPTTTKEKEQKAISLGLIEDITAKTFVAGKLSSLRPTAVKEEKGRAQVMFELKVNGAALGEIIAFVKEVEGSGLYVRKLQLNMPSSGQTFVDMFATITAG